MINIVKQCLGIDVISNTLSGVGEDQYIVEYGKDITILVFPTYFRVVSGVLPIKGMSMGMLRRDLKIRFPENKLHLSRVGVLSGVCTIFDYEHTLQALKYVHANIAGISIL